MTSKKNWMLGICLLAFSMVAVGAIKSGKEFVGSWNSKCHPGGNGTYILGTYEFHKDGTFQRNQKVFTDKLCLPENLSELRTYEGRYSVTGNLGTDSMTKKIDLTIDKVYDTAVGNLALKKFNESQYCKITDWEAGVKRDVTGLFCSGETIPAGTVIYDIAKRIDQNLYFGDSSYFFDVSKKKNRPSILDKQIAFGKE